MSTPRSLTQTKTSPMPSFTPVQPGLLQHKCACSKPAGLTGKCSECQSKKLTLQHRAANQVESSEVPPIVHEVLNSPAQPLDPDIRAFMESRFGHDSSQVRVHNSEVRQQQMILELDPLSTSQAVPMNSPRYQVTHQIPFGKDTLEDPDGELVRQQFIQPPPSSGTCQNGGGVSRCQAISGVYLIEENNNTCCTRQCTQEHEFQHVRDHDRWGCCQAFSKALKQPSADPMALKQAWNTWASQANLVTECNAYANDVACAQKLAVVKGCSQFRSSNAEVTRLLASAKEPMITENEATALESFVASDGATAQQSITEFTRPVNRLKEMTNCCLDIAGYEEEYSKKAESFCAQALKQVPPCPFIQKSGKKSQT